MSEIGHGPIGLSFARSLAVLIIVLSLSACGPRSCASPEVTLDTTPACLAPDPANPAEPSACDTGSGSFGRWIVDDHGLPAYRYDLAEESSPKATWWNSEERTRRDHWHQIGNYRLKALAYNEGYTSIFTEENGFKWLNYLDEATSNFGGGFSIIAEADTTWSTAYRYRPDGATTERVFGVGYSENTTTYNNLTVKRTTYAPFGNNPVFLSDVEITNASSAARTFAYFEYWDVNIQQVIMSPLASGLLDPSIPQNTAAQRASFNRYFSHTPTVDTARKIATIETTLRHPEIDAYTQPIPLAGEARNFDPSPPDIFLARLDGRSDPDERFLFDQSDFFGGSTPAHPAKATLATTLGVADAAVPTALIGISATGGPLMLTHGRRITVKPGETVHLRYATGYRDAKTGLDFLASYSDPDKDYLADTLASWKKRLLWFAPPKDGFLQREMAWNAYYLMSATYYRSYFDLHTISQGGTYLFGHGLDGVTRDYCIYAVAATYLDAAIAKEILTFVMMTTTPDGQMSYANYGDTVNMSATGFSAPSDLDIFFLWALGEYLTATRDFAFLDATVPYYSAANILSTPTQVTVMDHVRKAYDHLVTTIGTGEHGLIRIGTGDWSDGVKWFVADKKALEAKGESGFNTPFAVAVLPTIADAISGVDASLAAQMTAKAEELKTAFAAQFTGSWYVRGFDGAGNAFGAANLFLEPQVWSLIAGIPSEEQRDKLFTALSQDSEAASPLGAKIVSPPKDGLDNVGLFKGTDVNGGVWYATNALLTWGYSLTDPARAWDALLKNTLHTHAETYPDIWYGIWSGPDSYNAPDSTRPGEAAAQMATALTDWPIQNMNAHAAPLIGLIKVMGIKPSRSGITIDPRIAEGNFSFNAPLIGYTAIDGKLSGYYEARTDGTMLLTVPLSNGRDGENLNLTVEGVRVEQFTVAGGHVCFPVTFTKGKRLEWSID